MPARIIELRESNRAKVTEFLSQYGLTNETLNWKFFDGPPLPDAPRGFVLDRDGSVRGFVGIIPFHFALHNTRIRSGWVCDWYCAEHSSGGLLLDKAVRAYGHLCAIAGNENSRPILKHTATRTYEGSCVLHHLPIRLGAFLQKVRIRGRALPFARSRLLGRLPVRVLKSPTSSIPIAVESGVSPRIQPLLAALPSADAAASYDVADLTWQVGDCPHIHCHTILADAGPTTPAAGLLWRRRESTSFWRMATWAIPGSLPHLEAVIRGAALFVKRNGGYMLSIATSRLDEERCAVLRSVGFMEGRARDPLFVYVAKGRAYPDYELSELSYLAADLAYRF